MPRNSPQIKTFIKWAGLFVACLLVLVFLAAVYFSMDDAQGKASGVLSARIGRDVTIEGPVDIRWHWTTPRIHVEKIRVANAPGAHPRDMMRIRQLDFTVKIWKLLAGRLEIPEMRITRPRIFLERKSATENNWTFSPRSEASVVKEAVTPDDRDDVPLIDILRVREGKVAYRDIPRKIDMTLDVDTASGKENEAEETYSFIGKGTIEGHAFNVTAEGGSLTLLRDTRKPFPIALNLGIGGARFTLNGTFEDPVRLEGLDAALHLSGGNLADLFYLMHIPFPPTPGYKLEGQLKKKGNIWTFSSFTGAIGHSDLSGDVVYNTEGKLPLLGGTARSQRLDVADLGGLIGLSPAQKKDENAPILPAMPIDLDRLRAGNMNLRISAGKLNAPGWPLSDMETYIRLNGGLLEMRPLRFGAADGTVEGSIILDGRRNLPRATLDLQLRRLSLKRFFTGSAFDDFSQGYFGGRIQLAGSGTTTGRVLGNSNGRIVTVLSGGKISLLLMEAADIDIAQLAPLMIGDDRTTDIRCGIADFRVTNGLLQSQIFVLDTTDTNLEGEAEIDLKQETIRASLDAHPKDASIFSLQSRILVRGKIRDPQVLIDPLSLSLRGAAAIAFSALAPPAAILPFIQPGLGKNSDCERLLRETPAAARSAKAK